MRQYLLRLLITATVVLFFTATAHADKPVFSFTAIPDTDETRLRERFQKVADYLADTLDVEVRYIPVRSYAAAVALFRNDQVQLAWFGGLTGVRARDLVPGARAIAQGVEDTQFRSYFIAHKSTAIGYSQQLQDAMRGHTITFGSKSSTSGRLMPEFFLKQHFKKKTDELFPRIGFSGNHSRTIALVQSGAFDLGAVNYQVWEAELAAGRIDTDAVRVVWTTPTYPDYQWTVRGDVDTRFGAGFANRVQDVLLEMRDPELLATFPRSGFIPAENSEYQPIVDTANALGL